MAKQDKKRRQARAAELIDFQPSPSFKEFLAEEMAKFTPKSVEHQRQTGRFLRDHDWPILTEEQQRGNFAHLCFKRWHHAQMEKRDELLRQHRRKLKKP